ncbi:hypothetical protein [Nonomuraea sp. NPDC049480]|uniref:hypothetical protein n=1 Tax=Nonomuraea sp. NPDC049480 TaxID=3364353 RepID=UPI0037B8B3D6
MHEAGIYGALLEAAELVAALVAQEERAGDAKDYAGYLAPIRRGLDAHISGVTPGARQEGPRLHRRRQRRGRSLADLTWSRHGLPGNAAKPSRPERGGWMNEQVHRDSDL